MKTKSKLNKTTLQLLQTTNIKKKLKILDKLNGVNEKDSIKILLKILEDNSWTLREKAAYKLAHYGNRVVSRLEQLLTRGFWYTRASACLALGEIGNVRSMSSLVTIVIADDNPTVVKEASQALVKMAQHKPLDFAEHLRAMQLDAISVAKIIELIKASDVSLSKTIQEYMAHE